MAETEYCFRMSEIVGIPREVLDRARRSRDPRFDGKFFIAVLSTGIYCRSICPVRLYSSPVRYYASAAESAAAGFRPCLRCRPEAAPGSPAWTGTSAVVRRALRLIHEGALDQGTVEALAARVGVGARYLNRLLVEKIGASPLAIAQTRRLHFAKRLLDDTNLPVTEIALAAGYGSVRRFNSALKATYKRSPRELRKRRATSRGTAGEIKLRLAYRPPYDWDHMLRFLAQRAIAGVERVDAGGYTRTLRTSTGRALIQISACSNDDALQVRVRGVPSSDLFDLAARVRRTFDLAADPLQIAEVFHNDPLLGPLVLKRPGLRIPGVWDPYECAVRIILGEHRNPDAARRQLGALTARCGSPIHPTDDGLSLLFPTPSAIAEAEITGLGITPTRAAALRQLSCSIRDGRIRFDDSVEAVLAGMKILLPGSPTNAQHVALRALGEPDAFPSGDLILRREAAGRASLLTTETLEAQAESWRPWRGYAAVHLWAAADDDDRRSASIPTVTITPLASRSSSRA
jgi:AraC family transcriptional regulator of adaptative response / DNA-3-methyladenine glycosylase II